MARYVRKRTIRELSDDAKIAQIQKKINDPKDKNNKEHLQALLDKYGPYAYDIVQMSLAEPSNLLKRAGVANKYLTKDALAYFATEDVSSATLATAIKKREMEVDATLANVKLNHIMEAPAFDLSSNQGQLEQRLDTRDNTSNEPVVQEVVAIEQPKEQQVTPTNDEPTTADIVGTANLPPMTLDDYMRYYREEDRPLTGKAMQDAAYEDFGKGEGVSSRIYVEWQNKGNPTIGKGNLIFPEVLLDPNASAADKRRAGSLPAYKERFKQMELTKTVGGRQVKLTAEEKGKIFDDMVNAVKNKTLRTQNINGYNVITSPASAANIRMSETAMRKQFDKDYADRIQRTYEGLGKGDASKGEEIFNKYPRELQLSLLHAYYAGNPGLNISNAIKSGTLNPEDPVAVLTKLANERIVADKEALTMLQKVNPEEFTDTKIKALQAQYKRNKKKRAPIYDAQQMGEAADSLSTAAARRQAEMQIRTTMGRGIPIATPATPPSVSPLQLRIAMNRGGNTNS